MAAAGHAPAEKPKTPIRLEAVTSKTKTTRLAAALGNFDETLNVAIQCNMYIILYVSVIFFAFISTTLLILGTRSWRPRFSPWKSYLRFIRFIDTRRMLTPAPESQRSAVCRCEDGRSTQSSRSHRLGPSVGSLAGKHQGLSNRDDRSINDTVNVSKTRTGGKQKHCVDACWCIWGW